MTSNVSDMNNVNAPIEPGLPIPHRKIIRSWMVPLIQRDTLKALAMVGLDTVLFLVGVFLTVWFDSVFLKLLAAIVTGFVIGRIFILGHDACHQSFTNNRKLNELLGRWCFLPSLSTYSLWDVGHNIVHHGQTNLKGFDFVWAPASLEEFQAMPPWRKTLERIYRSGWGPGLYYFIEIWWNKMYFPNKRHTPAARKEFMWDSILVSVFALGWIALLVWAALSTNQSVMLTVLMGFVVPFVFWNHMIGFVVYVHHTHPKVTWYDNKSEWLKAQPFVSTTVHLKFSQHWGRWMHNIMEHTAHHVDMSVPLYNLEAAQQKLETMLPGRIIVQDFSWSWYFQTAKICKLYDTKRKCWMDFNGKETAFSAPVVLSS